MRFVSINNIKKFIIIFIFICTVFSIGFISGQKYLLINHFTAAASKYLNTNGDNIKATGEMTALDFKLGFRQRVISLECKKIQNKIPLCDKSCSLLKPLQMFFQA